MRVACLLLAPLCLTAAVQTPARAQVQTAEDEEANSVYTAILSTGWPKPELPPGEIAIQEKTSSHALCAGWVESLPAEWAAPASDYSRKNQTSLRLQANADFGTRYTLITSEKYEDLIMIAAGDADKAYADFRGGLSLTLSAVGFDPAKTRAIVAIQYACLVTCGGGRAFLLLKENGRWRVLQDGLPVCQW